MDNSPLAIKVLTLNKVKLCRSGGWPFLIGTPPTRCDFLEEGVAEVHLLLKLERSLSELKLKIFIC